MLTGDQNLVLRKTEKKVFYIFSLIKLYDIVAQEKSENLLLINKLYSFVENFMRNLFTKKNKSVDSDSAEKT